MIYAVTFLISAIFFVNILIVIFLIEVYHIFKKMECPE